MFMIHIFWAKGNTATATGVRAPRATAGPARHLTVTQAFSSQYTELRVSREVLGTLEPPGQNL